MIRSYYSYVVVCCALLASLWAIPSPAGEEKAAEHIYFGCALRDLPLTAGKLPEDDSISNFIWTNNPWNGCRVVLDGPGESYVFLSTSIRDSWLYARTKPGQALKGRIICVPEKYSSASTIVSFELPAEKANRNLRSSYFQAKETYYARLWQRGFTGSAWFRHQVDVARAESRAAGITPAPLNENFRRTTFRNESDEMFDLMSGGRAISENLQLRREMFNGTSADNQLVALDTVPGITTKEVDWPKLIKGLDPKIDSLAALIPADQHAVFFPSFTELLRIADEAEAGATPLVYAIEPRAEDAGTIDRYQTQLCLSRSGLSRVLGPKYIRSVAITGSDLNYRTGTDVAILFEAVDVKELHALLKTKIQLATLLRRDLTQFQGRIDGFEYEGYFSDDRSISSYLMKLGNAVIVSNSRVQMSNLVQAHLQRVPSLSALPEMKYFRDRYKLGDANEHAFVMLSDATIRRWCGPRWRIGSARQVRELATMMELTTQRLDELVQRKTTAKPLDPEVFQTKVDDYRLQPEGIESPSVGSLRFLIPIAELPLATATRKEVADYSMWRDGYQRNWTRGFDPIAIRLTLQPERIATDVTVLPLIDNTRYAELISTSRGSTLSKQACDAHAGALLQFALSVNAKNMEPPSRFASSLVQYLVDEEYLGNSLEVYLDDDPLWAELAKLSPDELRTRLEKRCPNLPLAIRIGVKDSQAAVKGNIDKAGRLEVLVTAFLGFSKRTIETHRGVRYVNLVNERDNGFILPNLYLTVCGDALTVTLNERTLKNSIDRSLGEQPALKAQQKEVYLPLELGKQAILHVDAKAFELMDTVSVTPRQREIQNLAWSNIPILNEWRRLYPEQDPVELHARLWKTRLVCPGGGKYVWNDEWQTMESTAFGHPAQPKSGPLPSLASLGIRAADFGLTFVDGGLRARVEIQR